MAQLHWFGDRFTINQSLVAQTQICYPNLGKRKFDKHNRPELKKGPALRQKQLVFLCDACTWRNIYGGIRSILLEFWDDIADKSFKEVQRETEWTILGYFKLFGVLLWNILSNPWSGAGAAKNPDAEQENHY